MDESLLSKNYLYLFRNDKTYGLNQGTAGNVGVEYKDGMLVPYRLCHMNC